MGLTETRLTAHLWDLLIPRLRAPVTLKETSFLSLPSRQDLASARLLSPVASPSPPVGPGTLPLVGLSDCHRGCHMHMHMHISIVTARWPSFGAATGSLFAPWQGRGERGETRWRPAGSALSRSDGRTHTPAAPPAAISPVYFPRIFALGIFALAGQILVEHGGGVLIAGPTSSHAYLCAIP